MMTKILIVIAISLPFLFSCNCHLIEIEEPKPSDLLDLTNGHCQEQIEDQDAFTKVVGTEFLAAFEKWADDHPIKDPQNYAARIRQRIEFALHFQNLPIPINPGGQDFFLPGFPSRSFEELEFNTGDLVLFAGSALGSKFLRLSQWSWASHVGVVVVPPDSLNTPHLFDTTVDTTRNHPVVQPLLPYLCNYSSNNQGSKFVLRSLNRHMNPEESNLVWNLASNPDLQHHKFEKQDTVRAFFAFYSLFNSTIFKEYAPLGFCSRLVETVYQEAKIFPKSPWPPMLPADFTTLKARPNVFSAGFHLEDEVIIKLTCK